MTTMDDLEPNAVCYVRDGRTHQSLLWHGQTFHGWPELLQAMAGNQVAVADTGRHIHTAARRVGCRISTRKRADGLLEIRRVT